MSEYSPVDGMMLKEFQEKNQFSVIEMCYFFGLSSPNSYNQLVKSSDPVPPTIALLYRLYEDSCVDLKTTVEPVAVYEEVKRLAGEDVSFRHFSILTGKAHTAYSSWITKGVAPNQSTKRLLYVLDKYLDKKGKKGYRAYLDMVDSEAKSRDIENIFSELSWE